MSTEDLGRGMTTLDLAAMRQRDSMPDVRFRGKAIGDLSREELTDALVQALRRLRELDAPSFSSITR